MAEARLGFFARMFYALDLVRRIFFTLLFFLIIVLIVIAMFSGGKKLRDKTTLVINLNGEIVEQFSGDPTEVAISKALGEDVKQVQLRDLRRGLELAAKDNKISAVLLRTDSFTGAGLSTLREVAKAMAEFKKSGKEIYSYAYGYDQRGLFLAAQGTRTYLHPEGIALLEGLGRYRTYYKDMLDKIGVQMNVFRVGEFKSAVEPYLLNGPSDQAREADRYWLDALWTQLLADFATARGIDPEGLREMIDQLPERLVASNGSAAQLAISEKLVDELLTPDQLRTLLREKGAPDDDKENSFRQISLSEYLERNTEMPTLDDGIGIIVAEGEILDGEHPPGTIGGDTVAKLVRQAREDKTIKAVVLRVDSPGGSGFASEVIRREIELTREAGKPVVVSMGDLAASGGYWISMTSDRIFAQPTTITGSIGIFGLFPSVYETLDKVGVHSDGSTTTWLAGALDITRPLDPRLGELLQTVINNGYSDFIGKVAASRGTTPEEIDKVARGRVWSGQQALDRGLVDEIGYLDDAIADAAKRAGLTGDLNVRYVEKEQEGFAAVMSGLFRGQAQNRLGAILGLSPTEQRLLDAGRSQLRFLENHEKRPLATYAHCLCDVR